MGSECRGLVCIVGLSDAEHRKPFPLATTSLEEEREESQRVRPGRMASGTRPGVEMPLEELLALYGYDVPRSITQPDHEPDELAASLPDVPLDKDQVAKKRFTVEEDEETRSSADDLTSSVTSDVLRHHLRAQPLAGDEGDGSISSSDGESDCTSVPSSDGRKDIMVGPQYQAVIPPLSTSAPQEQVYPSEDQLLWTPEVLTGEEVEDYLLHAQRRGLRDSTHTHTHTTAESESQTVRDNEQALYELVKCNFNSAEALRRLCFNVKVISAELCAWSQEECRNFEHGFRVHGKNFHLIQANKVRTRSVGECVEYYYIWKKSERHEFFTQQGTKLARRKYNLQTGSMEEAEQDGEMGEVFAGGHPHGSTHRPSRHLHPPTHTWPLDIDQQESESLRYAERSEGRPRRRRTPRFLLKP